MSRILLGISFGLMMAALYLVFIYVPTEGTMGVVQRIFYFHVPVAWVSFLAFFVVFIGSILFLWKRDEKWDMLARSSAEIGILFTSLVLITGPIWAKPAWGVWWTWDARLTTTLIMWVIYVSYLMVRSFAVEESRGARFAAVVGIFGFVDIPITAVAITLWRTQHPRPVIFEGGLAPSMLLTLIVCVAAFTLLYIYLMLQAISLKQAEADLGKISQALRG
ncbi:MAG: cytochrome C assembly protein [Chloroflexi bacterium RBG_13_52_14]|nr:MAG: cytochrome C assembly protein [Chloroflexi bacterium RBG_13_52_14]